MSYQAYLDNIQAKTGKTPDDFRRLAAEKGLMQYRDVMAWLKADFGLGHGHANALAHLIVNPNAGKVKPDERIAKLFAGKKEKWRKPYDALAVKLSKFGADVSVAPTDSYISLKRGEKKFGIVQPSAADHLDIGIKRKGVGTTKRFAAAGKWNAMVTHRVQVSDPKQIDKELLAWLKQAYDAA